VDRRDFLKTGVAASASTLAAGASSAAAAKTKPERFQKGVSPWAMIMNCATIRPVPLKDQVRFVAETGWDGIEPWMNDLEKFEAGGGDVKALGREIKDRGLRISNVIGLWDGMPEGDEAFAASLPLTRNRMRLAADLGSPYVAALPLPDRENFNLADAAIRYRELVKIGREEYNIQPIMEFVSVFKSVTRLGQAAAIALDADTPHAYVLPDTFHLWKGGSGFSGIARLQGDFIADFHWNDVPPGVTPAAATDATRILPGDGILPLTQCLKDLHAIGYTRGLSLELFNRELWAMDGKKVCELGLRKMLENVATAGV
jgi:sugar phosphate isomerase/epimerase